jgi:hypothetical protein
MFLKSAVGILLLLSLTMVVGILPLVPPLQPMKKVLLITFAAASLVVTVFNLVRLFLYWRRHQCSIVALVGGVLIGIVWLLFSGLIFLEGMGGIGLVGTELIKTVPLPTGDGTLYIYEKSSFPDGFESTTIAFGVKWRPFERKLCIINEVFDNVKIDGQYVEVHFIDGSIKRFSAASLRTASK